MNHAASLAAVEMREAIDRIGAVEGEDRVEVGADHMHAHACVHRDVSPTNVRRRDDNGRWVLADMGLVSRGRGDALTRFGQTFGTPFFTAPEVHHDPRAATPASDVYSLGALASWFTTITRDQRPTSTAGIGWWEMIRGTFQLSADDRWTVSEVAAHLASMVDPVTPVLVGTADTSCLVCGSRDGRDRSDRCRRCGNVSPY